MDKEFLTKLLKQEMVLAMGCTEPAACALSGACAADLLGCLPEKVTVRTTRDMLKNAMGVSIPGFPSKGVSAAVALGVACHDVSRGLNILSSVTEEQREIASSLSVRLEMVESPLPLSIEVEVSGGGHKAVAIVQDVHDNIAYMEKDGKVVKDTRSAHSGGVSSLKIASYPFSALLSYTEEISDEIVSLMSTAIKVNMKIATLSISDEYGLSVGRMMMGNNHYPPRNLQEAYAAGAALAAAGSDARMAGCELPVVINSGSGNQGLTLSVPIAVVGEFLKKSEREIAQALCLAELIGLVLTARKGRLSAQCGAFTAAIGTACGLCYLQGGGKDVFERVIKIMLGDLTGVVCDGAKMTCALKIYSCLQCACLACQLAFAGKAPTAECGIIGSDARETLDYFSRVTNEGMDRVDATMLDIMLEKNK